MFLRQVKSSKCQDSKIYVSVFDGKLQMTILSEETYSQSFKASHILSLGEKEIFGQNYWLAPNNQPGTLLFDLEFPQTFQLVAMVNTHNSHHKDRSSKQIRDTNLKF